MIIPIKPWLDIDDAAASSTAVESSTDWNGMALSSSLDMDEQSRPEPNRGAVSPSGVDNRNTLPFYHQPVLSREVLAVFEPSMGKQIFDGTLGGGGHAEMLLEAGAHVIGCDQDSEALEYASNRLNRFEDQFLPVQSNFSDLDTVFADLGIDKVDGILLDIGVSSRQLDSAERGFSFMREGPLDMRMNREVGESAADLVNNADEQELARIFRDYGEERMWRKAAKRVVEAREKSLIETTTQLSDVIGSVIPKRSAKNPATKIFQALRIAVNDELGVLETALKKASEYLVPGGSLAVITFHSLEDRIVKQFLKGASKKEIDRPEWPEPRPNPDYCYDLVQRKAIGPSPEEVAANPRSRSAKLRVGVRI